MVWKKLESVGVFFAQNEYTNRRMSDPSSSWNYFQHGSLKRTGVRKSRSELENVDTACNAGCNEVEAGNFEDGKNDVVNFFCNVSFSILTGLSLIHRLQRLE